MFLNNPLCKFISIVLGFTLVASSLCGCASKYGAQNTVVHYYPSCYRPIQDLRHREDDVAKGTAGGAFIGALGGALMGLLASGGKWQGAVVGAAAGGATGMVAGNIYAKSQQEADDNRRLAGYLQDLDGDISRLDVESAAARTSLNCYNKAFKALVANIKAGKMSRAAASQRYGEISAGREEAISILGDLVAKGENLDQQYENAFVQEEQVLTPSQISSGRGDYTQKKQTLNKARRQKQVLTAKTQALAKEKMQAQNESAQQTADINQLFDDSKISFEEART